MLLTANHTPDRVLQLSTLIFTTPSLHASYLTKRLRWQADLVPGIEARMGIAGGPAPDPRARAVIAAAFACADTASETWIAGGGHTDIGDLYDRSLAAVRDPG